MAISVEHADGHECGDCGEEAAVAVSFGDAEFYACVDCLGALVEAMSACDVGAEADL